jgi:hypothetical protein
MGLGLFTQKKVLPIRRRKEKEALGSQIAHFWFFLKLSFASCLSLYLKVH